MRLDVRRLPSPVAISLALAVLVVLPYADLVLASLADPLRADVLAGPDQDLQRSFGHWRALAAHEWAQGRIPWWNPYAYAGAPFLGNFQSAVLYPSTLLYLALPTSLALNADVLLHLWWAGLGTAWWARRRGSGPLAQLLAGAIVALGGPAVQLAACGHLSHLLAFAWAPWVLEARERAATKPSPRTVAWLGAATGLMLLAGNPQIAYLVALAACVLMAGDLIARAPERAAAAGLGLTLGVALAAAQWLPGLECSAESARDRPLPRAAALRFSLPPENAAATLVAPGLLGDQRFQMYWGRSALHEAEIFVGAAAIALALAALFARDRRALGSAALAVGGLALALGGHVPGFDSLRDLLPGYDRLRAPGRAILVLHLGLALVAARGLDWALGREAQSETRAARATFVLAIPFGVLAVMSWLAPGADGPVGRAFAAIAASGEASMPRPLYDHAPMRELAANHTACHAAAAAIALALAAWLLAQPSRGKGLVALALFELLAHASWFRRHAPFTPGETDPAVAAYLERELGDGRVHDERELSNRGASARVPQVWGLGPEVSRRYHELFARSQGADPDTASEEDLALVRYDRRLTLARLRFVITSPGDRGLGLARVAVTDSAWIYDAAPRPADRVGRFQLVDHWAPAPPGRDAAIDRLLTPEVLAGRLVILETVPDPMPEAGPGPPGTLSWREVAPCEVEISVNLTRPALLVTSDAGRGGWRVMNAQGAELRLIPANHAFFATALPAGTHRLTLSYAPRTGATGLAISAAAAIAIVAAWFWGRRSPARDG